MKLVTRALAISAAGSLAYAGPGADAEWSGLDSQLETIRSTYAADNHYLTANVGGVVQSALYQADAELQGSTFGLNNTGNDPNADFLGFTADALLWAEGNVGDAFSWRVSLDVDGDAGGVTAREAFADWNTANGTLRMGKFLSTIARQAGYAPEQNLAINPSIIGATIAGAANDTGVQYLGSAGDLDYAVSIMDGSDAEADELQIGGRAQWNLSGGVGSNQGAYGAPDELVGTVGVFYWDDGNLDNSDFIGIDAEFTQGQFSGGLTFISLDDQNTVAPGAESPFNVYVTFMPNDDVEIYLMHEDLDTQQDRTRTTLGGNYYQQGRNGYWSLNIGQEDINNNTDGSFIAVGWTLGDSGNWADAGSGRR